MVLPGKQRAGFVLMLIGIAVLSVSGGAWALFSGYGFVLLDAATGATSEVRHLNDLFLLQNTTWLLGMTVAVLLSVALVTLFLTEQRRDRNIREIIAALKAYTAGDWSRTPHVLDGDVEDDVAKAVAALAKAVRTKIAVNDGRGIVFHLTSPVSETPKAKSDALILKPRSARKPRKGLVPPGKPAVPGRSGRRRA